MRRKAASDYIRHKHGSPREPRESREMGIITDDKGVVRAIGESRWNNRRFLRHYWPEFKDVLQFKEGEMTDA